MGSWRMGYGSLEDGIWELEGWDMGDWRIAYEKLKDGTEVKDEVEYEG